MAKDILPGGLADNKPDSDFDPKALKEGVKVEKEHTSNPQIAKEVAKDHLQEFPKYYPALKVMENKLKREFKKSSLLKSEAPFKIGDRVSKKGEKVVSGTVTAIKPHRSGHKIKFKSDTHKPGELFHGGKGDLWEHASYFEKELKKSSLLAKAPLIGDYSQGVEDQSYKNKKNIKQLSHKAISNKHGKVTIHSVGNEDFLKGQGDDPFGWHYITANNNADGDVISFIKVTGADDSSPNGPYIANSFTDKNSRGMGLSSALHQYAANHHGVIYSDSSISPQEHSVWQQGQKTNKVSLSPTYPTSDMLHMEPLSTDTDDYDLAVSSQHSWKKNESKEKFKFKKSSLMKGSMRRLAPWNKEARQTTANMQEDLGDWQENANRTSRKNLIHQKIDDSSRKRTLHKLSSLTPTKVHPDGKRSFLLHRGMDIGEYKRSKIKGPQGLAFQHHEESSWTPNLTISGGFASDAGRDLGTPEGAHVSSWIHEDNIALMPNQHSQNSQSDQYKYEHEVIVKPRGISPLVHRDEVAKLTGVDKDDKYAHPGGKILDNPDRMINFRQQNQSQFGGDPVARNKYILPEFKRNRFKKSQLQKGVKQRLFPVKGGTADTPNPEATSHSMISWQIQANNIGRKQLASDPEVQLSPQAKARALHSLHGKTAVRRNKYGEREFLLHRGMGSAEKESALDIPSRQTMHNAPTSWTPNVKTPSWFEGEGDGAIVSAWIPESAIKHIPMQLGHPTKKRKNPFVKEHEVIVHPGNYDLVHDKEVKRLIGQGKRDRGPGIYSLDQAINFRDNPEVDRQDVTETYALQRRKFKKSQLAKSPIIHEQEDDFTYKTLDDNAFNEHFHEMVHEESLPNGLIHHIYQEKNSPDGIIHVLSQGDPRQPVSLIAGYIEHKGPYKGYNAHLTATAPEHQGQGHGTLLKELATKRHGRMVSDATLSPAEDRSWQKLKRPDIDVKFGQRFVGDIETHPDDANEAAQDAHIATYKKPLAASEFKKSSLIKGAARRLFPFNPEKDIDEMDEESIARWQRLDPPTWEPEGNEEAPSQKEMENQLREDVPEFKGPAQKRSLLKLHSKTQSRRNPDTGKVEYLLHRGHGKGGEETIWHDHDNKISKIPQRTSWTPHKSVADQFGIRQKGQSVSAWIPEDHIVNVPKQYGIVSVMPEKDRRVRTENRYADEHEVIVSPGTFLHGTSAVQPTIDTEITRRGSSSYPTEPADIKSYAKKRGRFQKSSIFSK